MDVSHVVFPIRTCTRTAPNPLRGPVYLLRIISDCFLSTYAKCHAPCAPGQSTTSERTLYRFAIRQILPHISPSENPQTLPPAPLPTPHLQPHFQYPIFLLQSFAKH